MAVKMSGLEALENEKKKQILEVVIQTPGCISWSPVSGLVRLPQLALSVLKPVRNLWVGHSPHLLCSPQGLMSAAVI